jgi:hypothetical protein
VRRAVNCVLRRWRDSDQDSDVEAIARRLQEEDGRSPGQRWVEGDYGERRPAEQEQR